MTCGEISFLQQLLISGLFYISVVLFCFVSFLFFNLWHFFRYVRAYVRACVQVATPLRYEVIPGPCSDAVLVYMTPLQNLILERVTSVRLHPGCCTCTGFALIPVRSHPGSLLWLCICQHDASSKFDIETSHTGATSPRYQNLYWYHEATSCTGCVVFPSPGTRDEKRGRDIPF